MEGLGVWLQREERNECKHGEETIADYFLTHAVVSIIIDAVIV